MNKDASKSSPCTTTGKLSRAIPIALRGLLFLAIPAAAAPNLPHPPRTTVPEFEITLDAGIACPDFELQIQTDEVNRVSKEFLSRKGNVVRTLSAGKGSIQTFTNVRTGTSITLKTGGSVLRTTPNQDGTFTQTFTGHNVIIFFPSDQDAGQPIGPKSTLFIGKVVLIADAQNNIFSIQQLNGKQIDICAALAI